MTTIDRQQPGASPRVVVYGTATCVHCRRAEELLRRKGIPFEAVDVTGDWAVRDLLADRADGRRTVPVIFIDGAPIGGYRELAALDASGRLDVLLGR